MLEPAQLEAVKASLFAGYYNLLLGSGSSLDSFGRSGANLGGASALTQELCALKRAKAGTSLARVSSLLSTDEVKKYLTDRYSACRPGETVKRLTQFIWRTAFTFNIDDTFEAAYESNARAKQTIESLNYDSAYKREPNRALLQIVHLHGFAREPEKGYVFSVAEYGRVTRGLNPWMHVLSELLATEPFIISGTSLNESDLEYYLSMRNAASGRRNRGPSILVEPYPDAITQADCERHGLLLVKATLKDFLVWLSEQLGPPPTVAELSVPPLEGIFKPQPTPTQQVAFFASFHLVRPVPPNPPGELTPFFFGQPPKWSDLESGIDVPTPDELRLAARARSFLESAASQRAIFCTVADAGAGRTTNLRRVAYDLAKDGKVVLYLISRLAMDVPLVVTCLAQIERPFALVIDGVADHASSLRSIFTDPKLKRPFLILCAERKYRYDHVDRLIGDLNVEYLDIKDWDHDALTRLIEEYRKRGLVGSPEAIRLPAQYADRLAGDSVAVAACRILNNFKPLEGIVKSLWKDAAESERRTFAIAALAEHCHSSGIFYPILERAHPNDHLQDQLTRDKPLPLAYDSNDDDYVLPLQGVIGERVLVLLSREKVEILLEVFVKLAKALAPYVNRRAIIDQTPEARMAQRLFHADQVVSPLLREHGGKFYELVYDEWQWNSRYWEHRALFTAHTDVDRGIQYARHAVAIEQHPYPWTTLASLLVRKLERTPNQRDSLFNEAVELLVEVMRLEKSRKWRPSPPPYSVLLHAANVYLELGGALQFKRRAWVLQQIEECELLFPRDGSIKSAGKAVLDRLGAARAEE